MTRLWKSLPVMSLVISLALISIGGTIAAYLERSNTAEKVNAVGAQARILASTVTAALSFHDRVAAQEYVNAVRANPDVETAAVYDADGSLFVSFARPGATPLPERVDTPGTAVSGDHLAVTIPATEGGAVLGHVYLRIQTESPLITWARYGIVALLGLMAAVVVMLLATAQNALRRANAELLAQAARLTEANANLQTEIGEREKAEAALRQAQKMEAIGQLTGGVAHDFNNLLMVISGGLDMLERNQDESRRRRFTDGMRHAVERGAALSQQLLTFARRQALNPEPIALARRIGGMAEILTRSLRGDIRVDMQFAADLWPVNVDPTQLELAVLNLAVNARDAMPSGGVLTIRAENAPGLSEDEISGDFVRLAVSDTGTGMTPETLARVFEPFFTTKDIGKGSGLGLAQIYGFVKQSGGVVRIASELGRGAVVTLILPRSQIAERAETDTVAEPSVGLRRRAPNTATILLIEDDEEVAALTADMIGQLGYGVTRVANALAALGALADGRGIDLVFSDVMMPGGMSGADLAKEIKRRRPGLPIVLTTGYDRRSLSTGDELGLPLLRKPYRLEDLGAALSRALGDKMVEAPDSAR